MHPTTTTALLPLTLSHLRTATSAVFLFLPSFTLRQWLFTDSNNSSAVTALRFAGIRELAIAQTLLFAVRSWRRGQRDDDGAGGEEDSGEGLALLDGDAAGVRGAAKAGAHKQGKAQRERERMVASALLAGAAVDGLDVLVLVLGYWEGTVPGEAALLTGCIGAVASLAGLGVFVGGGWWVAVVVVLWLGIMTCCYTGL